MVETGCDPGEVINIRSALASIYKKKMGCIGEWKVTSTGTDGSPTNSIVVNDSVLYYKRDKKHVGSRRALPFRYKYMVKLCDYVQNSGDKSLAGIYIMGATSV